MENKLVSIIMSVYNEKSNEVEESIKSILEQTYNNFEFIIILDNPENGVLKNILLRFEKQFEQIKVIINEENIGLASSLNRGIQLSKGDYICRMDADDISLENRIEKQVYYLENNQKVDLIGSLIDEIDENGKKKDNRMKIVCKYEDILRIIKYGNVFCHPTLMFRRKILDVVGGYRNFAAAQDYDFLLRVIDAGFYVENLPEVLLNYRVRENSITVSKNSLQNYYAIYAQLLRSGKIKFSEDNLKCINNKTDKDFIKFDKANSMFDNAKFCIRNKKYIGFILNIIKSILFSKYYMKFYKNRISMELLYTDKKNSDKGR